MLVAVLGVDSVVYVLVSMWVIMEQHGWCMVNKKTYNTEYPLIYQQDQQYHGHMHTHNHSLTTGFTTGQWTSMPQKPNTPGSSTGLAVNSAVPHGCPQALSSKTACAPM